MSVQTLGWVLWESKAEGNARLVMIALADNADDYGACWPSVATIAHKARVSERTVQRHIRALVELGELVVNVSTDGQTSSRYQLVMPRGDNLTPLEADRGDTAVTGGVTTVSPEPSVEPPKKRSTKTFPSDVALATTFEKFWETYPRKVGKREAERKFEIAARTVDPQVILAGALRYKASRVGQPGEYTKHPATWLHQGCWDDDPRPTVRFEDKDPDWAPWL